MRSGLAVLAVSASFGLGRLLAAAAVGALASPSPALALSGELTASLLVGATVVWLARLTDGSAPSRLAVIGLAAFGSVAAVMIEGSAFAPSLSPPAALPVALVMQLGVSFAVAGLAVALTAAPGSSAPRVPTRSRASLVGRLFAAGSVYVIAYFITGALNYVLVTGPYYETHAGGLTTPSLEVVLSVAVVEGLLLTIATVPLARAMIGSRWERAFACGLALYLLGGLIPLVQQSALPDVIRLASAVEILFQKIPLGIAIVLLFAGTRTGIERGEASDRLVWDT